MLHQFLFLKHLRWRCPNALPARARNRSSRLRCPGQVGRRLHTIDTGLREWVVERTHVAHPSLPPNLFGAPCRFRNLRRTFLGTPKTFPHDSARGDRPVSLVLSGGRRQSVGAIQPPRACPPKASQSSRASANQVPRCPRPVRETHSARLAKYFGGN